VLLLAPCARMRCTCRQLCLQVVKNACFSDVLKLTGREAQGSNRFPAQALE
jgi:hypothetical protein